MTVFRLFLYFAVYAHFLRHFHLSPSDLRIPLRNCIRFQGHTEFTFATSMRCLFSGATLQNKTDVICAIVFYNMPQKHNISCFSGLPEN
ncbi:hypothetical protein VTO58DRAFT_110364 [Aureobasidium pullulans]